MNIPSCCYKIPIPWTTDSCESLWAYLIKNGTVDPPEKLNICLLGIKEKGIDWGNTRFPIILETPDNKTILRGTLTLNDWTWYQWTCVLIPPKTDLNYPYDPETILEGKLK